MGAHLLTVAVRIPRAAIVSEDGSYDPEVLRRVVDAASDAEIVAAVANDTSFDSDEFGVDPMDFNDWQGTSCDEWGPDAAPAVLLANADAVASMRAHLRDAVNLLCGSHRYRNSWQVAGVRFELFGGVSWGDEPFDGFSVLCALACVPGFSVPVDAVPA